MIARGARKSVGACLCGWYQRLYVPPDKVVGANGAGDAFAAGVLYGLHEGWELEAAVRLGHAAAAVSLRNLGTTTAVLPVADCLAMAARWGWRAAAPLGD